MCWKLTAGCCRPPEHCFILLQASAALHMCWTPLWPAPLPGWQPSASRLQPQQRRVSSCHMYFRYCNARPCVIPHGEVPLPFAVAACCKASRVLHTMAAATHAAGTRTVYNAAASCTELFWLVLLPLKLQAWHQCPKPGLLLHTLSPVSVEAGHVLHTAHHALLSLILMSWAVLLQGIMQVGVLFTQVTTVTLMLAAVQALEVRPTLGPLSVHVERVECMCAGFGAAEAMLVEHLQRRRHMPLLGGLPMSVAASRNCTVQQRPPVSRAHGPAEMGHGCIPSGPPALSFHVSNALSTVAEAAWVSTSQASMLQQLPAS